MRHPEFTLSDYFMGRDQAYPDRLTSEVIENAKATVKKVNTLLTLFYVLHPKASRRTVNSGWRPPEINSRVPNAATLSKHLTAEALDISDDDGLLDAWLMTIGGQKALTDVGLWMEHPSATPRWCHLQTRAPRSGRRVFYP